jgi:pyruvate dehydrogenase E1 component alpha subunit
MGTALARSEAVTDLALRAVGYGMPAWPVDGMDVLAVEDAAQRAAVEVRGGRGPVFLELRTYRFRAHSMYDPERYRSKDEVAAWRQRDPIGLMTERLRAGGLLGDNDLAAIEHDVAAEIDAAVATAEAGTLEPVEDLTRFVTSEAGQ